MNLATRLHLLVALVCALTGTVVGISLALLTLTVLVTTRSGRPLALRRPAPPVVPVGPRPR